MNRFVGIDVSKAHLDWAIHQAEQGRVVNRATGIRRLVVKLRKLEPELVVVESTGGYERHLVEAPQSCRKLLELGCISSAAATLSGVVG